ncbi:unnamed protein product [Miscanthus lutarioriparius]|uniref:Protein kinase domain-containing protein n=1 Tax=Miscanthus lutarioriparius TaxID=422564 RepID=A0A811SF86_9POAL|nr:unnamed protein product [Miscanthus lutarioriparius]
MASLYLVRGILMLTLVLLNIHILKSNCESITRDSEKAALLKLEQDWGKPAALNWSSITNTDHCDWSGVICTDGFVTGLSLAGRDLYKPIPKAICSFKNLFYIDLSKNQISGSFRTSIFNCSRLQHLDLSFNSLFGFLPANIHKLSPKLAYLNLASNSLSGSIPSAICQLHGLRFLHLDNNYFNESYPAELGNLSELQVLSLAYNPFAPGRMHPQFGNLSNIKYLWMSNMNIVGEIPDTMSLLSQLRLLDLSSNRLNGMIPSRVWRLRSLEMLYLVNNSVWRLRSIFLNNNQLRGSFPSSLWSLPELTMIMIQENGFSGSLPKNNFISGEVPTNLILHAPLQVLVLAGNMLSGLLPSRIWYMQYLKKIDLRKNNLSGIFCFIKIRSRKKHEAPSPQWKLTTFQPISYNVEDILCGLTNNNLVGRGGSGKVYKICLGNNCKIAVKKIGNGLKKDGMLEKQFQAEIGTLGSIRHANIVKLLGFISTSESKLLIYEYMEHVKLANEDVNSN